MLKTVENPIMPKLRIALAHSDISETSDTLRIARSPMEEVSETKESDEADNSASDDDGTVISSKKSGVLNSIKNEILLSPLRNFKSNELQIERDPNHKRHKSLYSSLIKYNSQTDFVESTLPNI